MIICWLLHSSISIPAGISLLRLPLYVQFTYDKGTGTTHVLEVVNLMAAAPPRSLGSAAKKAPVLHATAYELPLLLPVMRMLPQLKKAILATRNKKVRHQQRV